MSARIGTVELLRMRVYKLDAECDEPSAATVIVEPGVFDLYNDGLCTFWLLRGKLNRAGLRRAGDGMFLMQANDDPTDIEVVFPSGRFGPNEWSDLLASPECTEGHEAQRLRVATFSYAVEVSDAP